MNEGLSYEDSNVVDMGSYLKKRAAEVKHVSLAQDEEGYAIYGKETIETTPTQALVLAKEIIEKFSDEQALLDDEIEREETRRKDSGLTVTGYEKEVTPESVRKVLKSQEEDARLMSTDSLIRILDDYHRYPEYYSRARLLAIARELTERLSPKQEVIS